MDSRSTFLARAIAFAALSTAGVAYAAEPVPPVTPEDRAAAFPEISHATMGRHMHDDPVVWAFTAEQFEWQDRDGDAALKWDALGWVGKDTLRLWLRTEGERVSGESGEAQTELLLGRPVAAWWDVVGGVRQDIGPGPARTYAAIGLQGLAPQWFNVEATAYVGERGQTGLRLQAEYDWLFTNRLILAGRVEAHAWGKDDEATGIGSGLSEIATGLRLRYEFRREFAPYVGAEWQGLLGDTADLAHVSGDGRRDLRLVAGIHFWF